jgi:hypothetical protein
MARYLLERIRLVADVMYAVFLGVAVVGAVLVDEVQERAADGRQRVDDR